MTQDKMSRDLIVMIGVGRSGKTHYVDNELLYGPQQLISSEHMKAAYNSMNMSTPDIIYAAMDLIVRSHMIKGVPIIVDESNLTIESLFLWKSIAKEFNYAIKGIVMDTSFEICKSRLESDIDGPITKDLNENMETEYETYKELRIILKMNHQQILDKVTFITYNGGSDHEIL